MHQNYNKKVVVVDKEDGREYLGTAIMGGTSDKVIFDQGPKCNERVNKVKIWEPCIPGKGNRA